MNFDEWRINGESYGESFSSDAFAKDTSSGIISKALRTISRVSNKLTGRDFHSAEILNVPSQVENLVHEATLIENLCQCYIGW